MPYRSPGAYARFVQTAGAVNSPGATRVMAVVGTGTMFYDVVNETIGRDSSGTSDLLANPNVWQVSSITSKPLYQGTQIPGTVKYVAGTDFDILGGQYVAWKIDSAAGSAPTVAKVNGSTTGSTLFSNEVTVLVDANAEYLVKNGQYRIEITYVDSAAGTYRVIDESTSETIGEYAISSTAVSGIIPGIKLTVAGTFVPETDGTGNPVLDANKNEIPATSVGDYVLINTVKGKVVSTAAADGSVYYVNYTYKKPDSGFAPKVFTDYSDVVAEYGNYDVTASGKIINSLALAAEIAFLNGVSPLVCVQAKNDGDFEMKAAIDQLQRPILGISNVNTVVAISDSQTVGAYAAQHVSDMSSPAVGKERMTYLAAPATASITDIKTAAQSYNNERVVYVTAGGATKQIKDLRTGRINLRTVPGSLLAVAVAALGLKNDPAEPLTNKAIVGFQDLVTLYTESEMNDMAAAGALVLKENGGVIKVRHGITTATGDVNSSEITLVQVQDYVAAAARQVLGDLYVGNKLKPTVIADIQSSLISVLNQFQGLDIILGYGGVAVKRSTLDPTAVDVSFEIEAIYPLNYIDISFSFAGVN